MTASTTISSKSENLSEARTRCRRAGADEILGRWELVSASVSRGFEDEPLLGEDPSGTLVYSDDGYFAVSLGRDSRSQQSSSGTFITPGRGSGGRLVLMESVRGGRIRYEWRRAAASRRTGVRAVLAA